MYFADTFVAEVANLAPAITGDALGPLEEKLRFFAVYGAKYARAEGDAVIAAALQPVEAAVPASAPTGVDPNLSIETYRALSEFSGINLSAFQRANNHWVSNAQTCHLKGSLNDRATRLEKVRFEQSNDESTTEEIGSFSISVKADKDVEIKNVSMFFRVLFVWVWGHVGAGMCQVSPQAGRPNAGRMGDEGGLPDGGRVYVTLASMMQYTYFLYSVAHRGVECLLQLHALVMRPVCDFVLHNDYNFASALTRVLSMHTSDSLLGRYSSGTVDKLPDSAAPGGKKGRGNSLPVSRPKTARRS
jgi:hypothetical protein